MAARFDVSGIDAVVNKLARIGEQTGAVAREMLMAGAEVVRQEWRASAERHGHRDTGDMIDSIGYPRKPKNAGDVLSIPIYPQGKDKKGVRNATKAFVLNYGTSKMPASHWVEDADAQSGQKVAAVFNEIFDKHFGKE